MKDIVTAVDVINQQAQLERDAMETLPGKFETCTFNQGYIRQPLYACKTCSPMDKERDTTQPAGMCYSCSIACHADHQLYELFPKRHFRCDCGVKDKFGQHPCELTVVEKKDAVNMDNKYNHNFEGRYCRCNEHYDPSVEEETMYQCILCEDWFHERCIGKIPDGVSDFESYICRACVKDHPFVVNQDQRINIGICRPGEPIHRWVGSALSSPNDDPTKDTASSITNTTDTADQNLSTEATTDNNAHADLSSNADNDRIDNDTNDKRKREDFTDQPEASDSAPTTKKSKSESVGRCKNLHGVTEPGELMELFLEEGWREGLCKCEKCCIQYKQNGIEFILQEEKTYEPEEDEDAGKSLMEIGMEQLGKMNRAEALDGLRIYHTMLDQIKPFLQTFKDSGRVVTASDIQFFFDQKRKEREEQKKKEYLS